MNYKSLRYASILLFLGTQGSLSTSQAVAQLNFEPQELATQLQVGYAVQALDVNKDDRLDIASVDSKRDLWLQSPNWVEHVVY